MVNPFRNERGWLTVEMTIALAILVTAVIPLAFSFVQEQRVCRAYYYRAVAMEIVDGEMEILAAGEWRAFADGQSPYLVKSPAATNLTPGQFRLTKSDRHLRLEWLPEQRKGVGAVVREVTVK